MIGSLKNFIHYAPLLMEFVKREVTLKYRRSILGYLWSLLNPLIMMIIVSAVFSFVFRDSVENFSLYLIIGQTFFNFFNESTSNAMRSLIDNSSLLQKAYIPKYIFPISKVVSSCVNLFYSLIAIVIVIIFTRTPITPTIVLLPIGFAYLFLFCIGVSLIMSVLAAYFRDMLHLYPLLLLAWMYLTPIFYSIDSISPQMRAIEELNPLYWYITYFRDIIMWGIVPAMRENAICLIWGVGALILGLLFFKIQQDKVILHI